MATLPAFVEARLPTAISYHSRGGPEFKTLVVVTSSGQEQRLITWAQARATYNISYGIRTPEQLQQVVDFFIAVRGQAIAFRFRDPLDHTATNEPFGVGDGTETTFQLVRHYDLGGGTDYARPIYKPVAGTVQVFGDDEDLTGLWTVDTLGVVTFTEPPANGLVLTWSGDFDVPCRFAADRIETSFELFRVGNIEAIDVVEIKL
jgi:uncharacterized protein (TIGR02217 family)